VGSAQGTRAGVGSISLVLCCVADCAAVANSTGEEVWSRAGVATGGLFQVAAPGRGGPGVQHLSWADLLAAAGMAVGVPRHIWRSVHLGQGRLLSSVCAPARGCVARGGALACAIYVLWLCCAADRHVTAMAGAWVWVVR
jgi:hypothetical protein